jgi:hypothetical protein
VDRYAPERGVRGLWAVGLELAFAAYGGVFGVPSGPVPDPAPDLAKLIAYPVLMSGQGTLRALSGLSLIVLGLALHGRLKASAPLAMRIATAAAVSAGVLFIVIGVGRLAIYDALAQVDGKDHGAAVAAYASVSVVSLLLNTAARAMFGVFVLIFSVVASRSGVISRPLLYAGIVFGIALIAAHVTGLSALSLALNIAMGVFLTVWPVWLGITLLRSPPTSAPLSA